MRKVVLIFAGSLTVQLRDLDKRLPYGYYWIKDTIVSYMLTLAITEEGTLLG